MKRILMSLLLVPGLVLANPLTTQKRMSLEDLNYFKPDCARKDEQLRWLASQMPSDWDFFVDYNATSSIVGYVVYNVDGSFRERQQVADRRYQAVIWAHADYLKRYCRPPVTPPAGCVTIREDTRSGSAVGKRCYSGRDPNPVINRWEPLVDR